MQGYPWKQITSARLEDPPVEQVHPLVQAVLSCSKTEMKNTSLNDKKEEQISFSPSLLYLKQVWSLHTPSSKQKDILRLL